MATPPWQSSAAIVTQPNAHALVQRFPLLDNFYDPSRQSADGHNWIVQAMAPYSDDIQSPDWVRDYPSNGGDAIAYQKVGNLYDAAAKAGIKMKNYGEYVEYNPFSTPDGGSHCEPSWSQFYNDTVPTKVGHEQQLYYFNTVCLVLPAPGRDQATRSRTTRSSIWASPTSSASMSGSRIS